MKKITLLFSAIIVVTLSFYSCEQSQNDPVDPSANDFVETKPLNKIETPEKILYCGEDEVCLWAGQHINAGSVTIGNDDTNLYITVYSKEGFQNANENLKIWVGTELPDKRPAAGHFPYKTTVMNGEKEVTYQIPLSDLYQSEGECAPHQFYVLVHADVIADGGSETAWGGCEAGAGKAWWFYSEYWTQCCECWCGFGNDYQTPEAESCLSMMFQGTKYIFWSNQFNFKDMVDKDYALSLIVNPDVCVPQDTDGTFFEPKLSTEVGTVVLKPYKDDGKWYVDVSYTLFEKYKGYNIQLDMYLGADRIPKYNFEEMKIFTDENHMLYQHKLEPGETTYTFMKLPWFTNGDSDATYMSFHAAIGDCPMPSLQNPMDN